MCPLFSPGTRTASVSARPTVVFPDPCTKGGGGAGRSMPPLRGAVGRERRRGWGLRRVFRWEKQSARAGPLGGRGGYLWTHEPPTRSVSVARADRGSLAPPPTRARGGGGSGRGQCASPHVLRRGGGGLAISQERQHGIASDGGRAASTALRHGAHGAGPPPGPAEPPQRKATTQAASRQCPNGLGASNPIDVFARVLDPHLGHAIASC